MTDIELHKHFVAGVSVNEIARLAGVSKDTIASRIARARRREGEERWPRRPGVAVPKNKPRPAPRAGASTLPPLRSLAE